MYRVIIVDDEPIIRLGVKASIFWEEQQLKLAGECANGVEALAVMEREAVDILITDIKMPLMDGLELTRIAVERCPGIKVILISSYNDFEYARQGILLGAVDYILKPTLEPDILNPVIRRCIETINKEKQITRELGENRQVAFEKNRKKLEHELKKVICREKDGSEIETLLSAAFPQGYLMIYVVIDHLEKIQQQYGFLYSSILLDELQEQFYFLLAEGIAFAINEQEMIFMLPNTSEVKQNLLHLKTQLEQMTQFSLTFGYIKEPGAEHILNHFEKCKLACEQRFFMGFGEIYDYIGDKNLLEKKELKGDRPFIPSFAGRSFPQPDLLVEEFLQQWDSFRGHPQTMKNGACELFSNLFINQLEPALLIEYYRQFMKACTLHELKTLLVSGIHECRKQSALIDKKDVTHVIIEKAMSYIRDHFTNDITLQEVADHVHMSKNYFSLLYKKYTNQNFIEYIMQLRIQRAKELLGNRSIKIYKVAEKAGFNDVKYFSKLFKKLTGSSPIEFREIQGNLAFGEEEQHCKNS
jgi:two-component system response regulator YesN